LRRANAPFAGGIDERHGTLCKELEQARIDTLRARSRGDLLCTRRHCDKQRGGSPADRGGESAFMEADLGADKATESEIARS